MRLVDADKLKEWILEFHPADAYWAISMLENAPTVDAEPVVHAHWIEDGKTDKFIISSCSNCGGILSTYKNAKLGTFCLKCGAKMDEEVIDNA